MSTRNSQRQSPVERPWSTGLKASLRNAALILFALNRSETSFDARNPICRGS